MDISEKLMETLEAIRKNTLLASKNVLTLEEACLVTGLSKARIYTLTSNKQIPHYKLNGRKLYFNKAELERWLLSCRVDTTNEADGSAALRDYINNK